MNFIDIDSLHSGSLFIQPIHVEGWDAQDEDGEYKTSWTEAAKYNDGTRDWMVVVQDGTVVRIWSEPDSRLYGPHEADDFEEAQTERGEDSGDGVVLDEADFQALFEGDTDVEGPMMNYWYACEAIDDDNVYECAVKIADLPLCIVEVGGTYGFALTGGGQDMSWDICLAFMRVGQLPPVHYARDLPAYSGAGRSDRDKTIIAACVRAMDVAIDQLTFGRERLVERFTVEMESA